MYINLSAIVLAKKIEHQFYLQATSLAIQHIFAHQIYLVSSIMTVSLGSKLLNNGQALLYRVKKFISLLQEILGIERL